MIYLVLNRLKMKYKIFMLLLPFILISCNNTNISQNSSLSNNNENSCSFVSSNIVNSSIEDNKTIITFNTEDKDINNWFICSNDINFKLDNDNTSNITTNENNIELSKDNNISCLSFSISKIINKIEINILNEIDNNNISIGVINKYGVKAEYKFSNNKNIYYYEFADYLKAQHIYIESNANIIIKNITLYY